VIENTRYVALEFGVYGYKPHRCVQTVTRGWGDCKDKATVIVTLLKELGIKSTIVILRSGLRGDFEGTVASLAPFDHAIVYVPELDLYLDGTAEYTGSSELPALDANSIGLRINEGKSELVRLPVPDPEKNVRTREVTATLRKDGGASVEISFTTAGTAAASWRRRFHAESSRRDRMTEDLGVEFQGFELAAGQGGLSTGNLDDPEQPVSIKARGNALHFGRPEGDAISVPVTPNFRLSPAYASLSSRRLPVRLLPLGTLDETFVIKLPPGFRVISPPPRASGTAPFGSYSVAVEEQPGKIVVHTRLTIKVVKVPPENYDAWKQFCRSADAALTPRLVVGPS
jgi:cellulose synthase operon protein C